jgi:hypothetical protein
MPHSVSMDGECHRLATYTESGREIAGIGIGRARDTHSATRFRKRVKLRR